MPRPPDETPGVQVRAALTAAEREVLERAGLRGAAPVEAWSAIGSNRALATLTHGLFRYFGKLPPPIVRRLIELYTRPGETLLDPMVGSGTSAVEALRLARPAVARDVSPLCLLLTRVKTTHVALAEARHALARVARRYRKARGPLPTPVGLRNAAHWFLPETMESLGRLRAAVESLPAGAARELLLATFAATVRRVSRATTQQGRLFLDAATAEPDAWPRFAKQAEEFIARVACLPARPEVQLAVEPGDARTPRPADRGRFRLVLAHPPYFNNYRYSSVNALELAWLGYPPAEVRPAEIREAFKVGKTEKFGEYQDDLAAAVQALEAQLAPGGALCLIIGDAIIRGEYLRAARGLLERLPSGLTLERIALRIPRYTEASWVASLRRRRSALGVHLLDYVLVLRK